MRSKDIGTAAETVVARFFQKNGFAHCERRALAGSGDKGDLVGLGPICVEVKGGKAAEVSAPGDLVKWQGQTDVETANSKAEIGLLVTKRKGVGAVNAGQWWCWARLSALARLQNPNHTLGEEDIDVWVRLELREAVWLLRHAGHGTPFWGDR